MGRPGVLSSSEDEASLSWLDQAGEQSSVLPRSLSRRVVGADRGQTGIVRGSRTGVAGRGPAGTTGRGLRTAPTRLGAGVGGGGLAGASGERAGARGGTPSLACTSTASPRSRGGRADEGWVASLWPGPAQGRQGGKAWADPGGRHCPNRMPERAHCCNTLFMQSAVAGGPSSDAR